MSKWVKTLSLVRSWAPNVLICQALIIGVASGDKIGILDIHGQKGRLSLKQSLNIDTRFPEWGTKEKNMICFLTEFMSILKSGSRAAFTWTSVSDMPLYALSYPHYCLVHHDFRRPGPSHTVGFNEQDPLSFTDQRLNDFSPVSHKTSTAIRASFVSKLEISVNFRTLTCGFYT